MPSGDSTLITLNYIWPYYIATCQMQCLCFLKSRCCIKTQALWWLFICTFRPLCCGVDDTRELRDRCQTLVSRGMVCKIYLTCAAIDPTLVLPRLVRGCIVKRRGNLQAFC